MKASSFGRGFGSERMRSQRASCCRSRRNRAKSGDFGALIVGQRFANAHEFFGLCAHEGRLTQGAALRERPSCEPTV